MKSPVAILLAITLSVFISEILVMLLLFLVPDQPLWIMALIDGVLLVLVRVEYYPKNIASAR